MECPLNRLVCQAAVDIRIDSCSSSPLSGVCIVLDSHHGGVGNNWCKISIYIECFNIVLFVIVNCENDLNIHSCQSYWGLLPADSFIYI